MTIHLGREQALITLSFQNKTVRQINQIEFERIFVYSYTEMKDAGRTNLRRHFHGRAYMGVVPA